MIVTLLDQVCWEGLYPLISRYYEEAAEIRQRDGCSIDKSIAYFSLKKDGSLDLESLLYLLINNRYYFPTYQTSSFTEEEVVSFIENNINEVKKTLINIILSAKEKHKSITRERLESINEISLLIKNY